MAHSTEGLPFQVDQFLGGRPGGWRETMVGTLSFYDKAGERQHTVYLAATPEYGKAKFLGRLEAEVGRARAKFPDAH